MDILRSIYSENIPIDEKIAKGFDYIKRIEYENEEKTK